MRWSDIPRNPTTKMLREFAGLWLIFFGGLAAWQGFREQHTTAALVLAIVAVGVGVPGLIAPRLLRPIFVAWMMLAFPIGWVVSHVLLGLVFFGLFLPVGLIMRLAGRDALMLRRRSDASTYWLPKPAPAHVRQYFRQF